jgi:hypothetical protein
MFNNKYVYITLFMLFQHSLFYSQLSALDFDKQQGFYSVGVQYGSCYQWSDVSNEAVGWGTTLTLGKNLYYSEHSFLTLDLRTKLFFGVSKGLDGTANPNIVNNEALNGANEYDYLTEPGYFFNNYKNSFISLDLEPNIIVNKFRAETGWFLNLFGGAGFGLYTTRMDLADSQGDYVDRISAIDMNVSSKEIKNALREFQDNRYESRADGFYGNALKIGFMPSVGLELGFDINRFLTAYLGHKTIFARSDHLDGQHRGDPDNDLLNFTHIGLQVNFSKDKPGSRSTYRPVRSQSGRNEPVPVTTPQQGYPQVEITYPEVDWFNTSKPEMEVVAELQNVNSVLDISCMVNGKEVAFDYDRDVVRFYAYLQRGTNVLKVQVRNDQGEARDIKRVIFTPAEEGQAGAENAADRLPLIELISPESTDFYAEEDVIEIRAYVENVESKDDIKLSANGMDLSTFRYDEDLGVVSIKVRLAKGTNKFLLAAYNAEGKQEQEFRIFYGVDPEAEMVVEDENSEDTPIINEETDYPPIETNTKPFITLLSPKTNPYITTDEVVFLQLETHGVDTKDDIIFLVNGVQNHFYEFDYANKMLSDEIHLMELETEILITVKNAFGKAEKMVMIQYGQPGETIDSKPKVKIIEDVNVTKPDEDCYSEFLVTFNESVGKDNIEIKMNDFTLRNYRYVEDELKLRFSLYLDEGVNDIQIAVNAGDRSERASVSLNCGEGTTSEIVIDEGPVEDTTPASLAGIQPDDQLVTETEDLILNFKAIKVNNKADIMIFLNDGIIDDYDFDPNTGNVQALLTLVPRENEVLLRVSNDYGTDERALMYFYDEPFRTAPSVIINAPRNGFTTDENKIIFRASVEFIKSIDDVQVFLNGDPFTDFNYNEEFGKIQAIVPLQLGNNTLEVVATNKIGSSAEKINFKYKLEYEPAVQILGPKEGLEYRKAFAMLSGIVQNMKDKRGIGIQINREPYTSLIYDPQTEMVSSRLMLDKGNNEIILSAKNDYGFASDTINIFFRGVPEKPSISFLAPKEEGSTTTKSVYNFEAEVLEINHSINVELVVNGQSIEEIYYFKNEKLVRAEINLKKGRNDIKLTATNDTGTTTARTTVYLR